ncbi:MAG TPA: homoserine dehydrogenase, partial [Thermosynergistes sp.]|nr:homoserine dehydrogenase [Thermosynergistes sp.]
MRVLLLGFGNVGRQFCEMLSVKANFLRASYGLEMCVVGVATRHRGSVCASNGLPIKRLLKTEEETGRVDV